MLVAWVQFLKKTGTDSVFAVIDTDNDGTADKVITLLQNLVLPSGITLASNGDLYVAAVDKIYRIPKIDQKIAENRTDFVHEVVYDSFPTKRHHGWKYLRFGPDGLLYVPIGAPCNICDREDPFFTIVTMNLSSTGEVIPIDNTSFTDYCHGVRNSVGFDFHPLTKELWFTDNGRDWMGSEMPHDELNRASSRGLDYGFPYCHSDNQPDPNFNEFDGKKVNCSRYTAPAALLEPHAAAIGMSFYNGSMFPESYKNAVFIAEHGSWNSNDLRGYKVTVAHIDETGTKANTSDFLTGFVSTKSQVFCGRPADVIQLKDGSLLVSDDHADKIYRISYG